MTGTKPAAHAAWRWDKEERDTTLGGAAVPHCANPGSSVQTATYLILFIYGSKARGVGGVRGASGARLRMTPLALSFFAQE
jgi:hypothetical protein